MRLITAPENHCSGLRQHKFILDFYLLHFSVESAFQ